MFKDNNIMSNCAQFEESPCTTIKLTSAVPLSFSSVFNFPRPALSNARKAFNAPSLLPR